MHVVNDSQLSQNLASVMDRVVADREPVVVTRQGAESVVIVPQKDWEGLQETLHLLGNPVNAKHLLDSIAQAESGRFHAK